MEQGPALWAIVGHKDGSGQALGIRIDGIPKKHQLNQRDADHHTERHTVAAHLDEFFYDDRP